MTTVMYDPTPVAFACVNTSCSSDDNVSGTTTSTEKSQFSMPEMLLIATVAGCLSLLTVGGNVMVMISFKIDKQLQTISNYFLFSLAIADCAIGMFSMPLFTVSLVLGEWPLGPHICDTWLSMDYLASNASVLNLLIISFDRYFSVTRPLTYRARRTTKRAAFMIFCAWGISLLLWPPWIFSWPYIEGERTVPEGQCYIQFIETNHYITFGTAIAAFYIPVTVMIGLYWRIWRETEKRQKDLTNLQAGKKDNSRRSNSSDEAVDPTASMTEVEWKRSRSESSTMVEELETTYVPTAVCLQENSRPPFLKTKHHHHHHQASLSKVRPTLMHRLRSFCATCVRICRLVVDREDDGDDAGSEMGHGSPGCATPASVETPLQSSVSRCTSLNVIRDPYATPTTVTTPRSSRPDATSTPSSTAALANNSNSRHPPPTTVSHTRSHSSDSVYTILIRLPPDTSNDGLASQQPPSIKMIPEEIPPPPPPPNKTPRGPPPPAPNSPSQQQRALVNRLDSVSSSTVGYSEAPTTSTSTTALRSATSEYSLTATSTTTTTTTGATGAGGRRLSQMPDIRIPLNAKIIPKQLASKGVTPVAAVPKKKKKKSQEKKQDKKAAKTLSAILLAFIITWTPYNVLVLLKTLMTCEDCIPEELWNFSYYLCYINSTINPMCYALCNASFRRTYVRILTCKWNNRKRHAVNKGFYN